MTEVRLFASLREAAGTARVRSSATTVRGLLDELRERFGPEFARRLTVASVVVDGDPVDHDADRGLEDAEEVALLPPFSGGCGTARTGVYTVCTG